MVHVKRLKEDYVSNHHELNEIAELIAKEGDLVYRTKSWCECKGDNVRESLLVTYGGSNVIYMNLVCCPVCEAKRYGKYRSTAMIYAKAMRRRKEDRLLNEVL